MRSRIFLLFLSLALSITLLINMLIFAFTAWKEDADSAAALFLGCAGLSFAWLIITRMRISKHRLHMVSEVAFPLYPLAGFLALALSIPPAWWMWEAMNRTSFNPFIAAFTGILIALFLAMRFPEIRFLPSIDDYEDGEGRMQ